MNQGKGARAVEPDDQWRASQVASQIHQAFAAMEGRNAPTVDRLRKRFTKELADCSGRLVLDVGLLLAREYGYRSGICYELIRNHRAAFALLGRAELEELGQGIDSWGSTDSFARHLSGPAWVNGQIRTDDVEDWARSSDRWWRRAALVSTVAPNSRVSGGTGDGARTLEICGLLVDDHDDMVVKAMSWALRDLIAFDRRAVVAFLEKHEERLAARVKREVRNKLETGLKTPKKTRS